MSQTPPPTTSAPPRRQAKFLQGNLMRHVAVMSLSASVGLVSIFLVDFVDLLFIAQLGDPALTAAVGFAATILYLTFAVTLGLTIACSALSARLIGMDDLDGAREMATNAVAFGVSLAFVIAAVFWVLAPGLVDLLGAKGDARGYAISYFRIVVLAMPVATVGMMTSGLLRAHGDARRAMMVTLVAGGVNAVLDPIFIFGFGWGLEGAAYASVCARFATLVTALIPVIRHYGGFAPFKWARFRLDIRPILALTIPAILTNVATPVGNSIVTRVLAPFGDEAVSGMAVVARMTVLAFCVIFALSGAVGPIIGQNFGARQYDRVKETLTRAMVFAAGFVVLAWVMLVFINGWVSDLFKLTDEGRDIVFWFAVLVAPLFIFNGSLFISNAAFNNLKRPLWSSMLNWGKNTVGVAPFVVAGAAIGGAPGVIVGQAVGGIMFGVLGLWLAYRLVNGFEKGTIDPDAGWRPRVGRLRRPAE